MPSSAFERFQGSRYGDRPEEYRALKETLKARMLKTENLAAVERFRAAMKMLDQSVASSSVVIEGRKPDD